MSWASAISDEMAVPGGAALVLARGVADAALLVAFGTPLCRWLILRTGGRAIRRLEAGALVAALLLTLLWAALQANEIADDWSQLPSVASDTLFGHLILLRLALLAAALLALPFRLLPVQLLATGLALVSQAGLGHAYAMTQGPTLLLLSELLHLLAAGSWLGALPALALGIASLPLPHAAAAARQFGPLGTVCVLVLALTAAEQASVLVGGLPRWLGTAHGLVALGKLTLFAILVGFAARHRFRLAPALSQSGGRQNLVRSIIIETGTGLAVVLAAAWLANLSPARLTHPVWPFAAASTAPARAG